MDQATYQEKLALIKEAANKYYNENKLIMSDGNYDALFQEIITIENEHPQWVTKPINDSIGAGAAQAVTNEITHQSPMLSLKNTYTLDDVNKFTQQFKESHTQFIVEPKFDGISASVVYHNGKIQYIASRGNGKIGDDLSKASVKIAGLPLTIDTHDRIEIRGELIMNNDDYEAANTIRVNNKLEPYLNPRNGVSGATKAIGRDYEIPVSFYGYDVLPITQSVYEDLDNLRVQNYKPVIVDAHGVADALSNIENEMKKEFLPLDGAVIKVHDDSVREKIGFSSRYPKWAVAYKFPIREVEILLHDVTWATGRSGVITPRAIIEPVIMMGSKTQYVTLHNPKYIKDRDLMLNEKVLFYKAGYIIPRISGRLDLPRTGGELAITIPDHCPACNASVDNTSDVLRCVNDNCDNPVKTIYYAASKKALDIDGLGETITENVVEILNVKTFDQLFDITKEDLLQLPLFAESRANKLLAAIDKARNGTFEQFFTAFGFSQAGESLSYDFGVIAHDLQGLLNLTVDDIHGKIRTVKDKKSVNIIKSIHHNAPIIQGLIDRGINPRVVMKDAPKPGTLTGLKFVLTGAANGPYADMSRGDVEEIIVSHGGERGSSISAKTNYLVSGEKSGSKVAKAEKLGVKVITFTELSELIQ